MPRHSKKSSSKEQRRCATKHSKKAIAWRVHEKGRVETENRLLRYPRQEMEENEGYKLLAVIEFQSACFFNTHTRTWNMNRNQQRNSRSNVSTLQSLKSFELSTGVGNFGLQRNRVSAYLQTNYTHGTRPGPGCKTRPQRTNSMI
jgi:hypothetical protein